MATDVWNKLRACTVGRAKSCRIACNNASFHCRATDGAAVPVETTGAASQLSVAVAVPVLEAAVEASHSTVTFAGQVMTGAVESATVII